MSGNNPFSDPSYGLDQEKPAANPFDDPEYGKEGDGDFVRGLKNYIPQTKQIGGDLTTLAGLGMKKAFGPGEVSQSMIDKGQEWSADAAGQMTHKDTDEFTGALDKGVGSLLTDYVPYQAGQAVGMIGESLATAAAGAAIGGAIGSAGAGVGAVPGALAGGIAGAIEGAAVKQGVKALARKLLAEQGESAAQSFLAKEAAKATGQKIGLNAGLAAGALAHGFGETGGRAIGEATKDGGSIDNVDFGRVVPAAIGHAGLEFVGDKIGLGAISKEGWRAAGAGAGAIAKTAAVKAGVTGLKEAPVEAGQTVLERYAGNLNLADAEAGKEYLNAAAAGATMGGVIGGAGGVHTALSQPDPATFVQPTPTAENPAPAPVPRPNPNAGALSRAAAALPAPSIAGLLPSPEQTLFADAAGNVSSNGPTRDVDREYRPTGREQGPQNFGPGMDRQAERGAAAGAEGDYIPRSQYAPKNQSLATQNTFDGERPALTDTRPQGTDSFTVDAAGNAVADKVNRAPTADYVQGGRGMDQPTFAGQKYSNPIQAKNAIQKAGATATHEAVQVGPKQFEVQPIAAPTESAAPAPAAQPPALPVAAPAKPQGARKIVDRDRDTVAHAVMRLGGINIGSRQDSTGEIKGNSGLPGVGYVWSNTGTGLDEMASKLNEQGFVPAGEMNNLGGVPWLQSVLGDHMAGRKEHFAPGSARQEAESLKQEADRQEARAAQEEAGGDFDSAEPVVSDLLDDADLLEIRASAAAKHAAELDEIFGDSPNETVAGTQSADRPAEEAQRPGTVESGSAGAGQRPQGGQSDARAESQAEEAPSLELTQQTEASAAADAAAQAERDKAEAAKQKKLDDAKKKADNLAAIKAANTKANDGFQLGQSGADNLSGQGGMFDSQPSLSEQGGKPAATAKTPKAPASTLEQANQAVADFFDWYLVKNPNANKPMPGIRDGNTFTLDAGGAPYTKAGQVMVNGNKALTFNYASLWKAAQARATQSGMNIQVAADQAATSPNNDLAEPTDKQKEAGNYQKGHVSVQGLALAIENPKGSARSGKRADGSTWSHTMSDHYGYIKRTEGADGDHVDIYLGANPLSDKVFVVDQVNADGTFDEHKVMLGFDNKLQATNAYSKNFDKGWKVGKVTALSMDGFKAWLANGDQSKPLSEQGAESFVKAPDGSLEYGEITAEIAKAAGRQAGKIRLQQGNDSWGLQHIEARHGAEIRAAGFADVPAFVADIAQHIDQVWKPATTRQLVALHKAGSNRMMFVELQPAKDDAGDYYSVRTAYSSRRAEKKGWSLLWETRAQVSDDSGNRPSFAVSPQNTGEEVTNPPSQSSEPTIAQPEIGKPAAEPKAKIEDTGDQLKYNKKGMFRSGGLKWSDIQDENEAMKVKLSSKEKIWARPDWVAIIEAQPEGLREGFTVIAHLIKQVYDGIPKQSAGKSDEGLQTYIAAVGELRDAAEALLSDNAKVKPLVAALAARAARRMGSSISMLDMVNGDASSSQPLFNALFPEQANGARFARGTPANDKANALDKAVNKMQWGADSAVDAMKAIKKGWPAKQEAWQKQGYAVFDNSADEVKASHYEGSSGVSTTLKLGSSTIEWLDKHAELGAAKQAAEARLEQLNGKHLVLNKRKNIIGAFDTSEEAEDFARKQTARKRTETESETEEADENWWSRAGDERRPGNANVTEDEFKIAFGFRGVNFGKWVNQTERQQHLNAAFDAFHDLAAVLDIPPKAISLNGMLGMAFGAQGGGSAAAHFVAGVNEINLTKTAGAGALAHEWAHGLDHYFGVKAGLGRDESPFASTLGSRRKLPEGVEIRPEVAQAFKSVVAQMRAIEETPEQAAQAARTRLDQAKIDIAVRTQPMRELLVGNAEALAALDKVIAGDVGEYITLPPAKGKRKSVGAVAANIKTVFEALGYSNEKMAADGSSLMGVYFAKPEVGGVVRSRIKHTDFYKKSQARDGKSGNYWATQWEMFARGFESWVMDKLAGEEKHNNYLVRASKNDRGATDENFPYPAGEERKAFNQAIDVLTAELKASAPDESGNVALYRLNTQPTKGIPLFSAKAIAKKLNDKLRLSVKVVAAEADLPAEIQAQIQRDGASGKVGGVFHNGQSFIIASNLSDTKHAVRLVLHEAIGHGGVQAVLGAKLGNVMRSIYRDMPAAMRRELETRYAGKLDGLSQAEREQEVAEEYVAHIAEYDPQNSLLERIVSLIRTFIRDTFGDQAALKWSRNDIIQLLAEAKRAARNDLPPGGNRYRNTAEQIEAPALMEVSEADEAEFVASLKSPAAVTSIAGAMYKAKGTESPFFQRWFAKSKMVDRTGAPVAFVHRSFGDKASFDDARLGGITGTPTAALGHFLARKDVGNVERYGPVTDQFFIRMEKPKIITQAQFEAMGDWSVEQVQQYRAAAMKAGHDGLYIQGLGWPVVFEGKNIKGKRNTGTFDESANTRYGLASDARAMFDRTTGPAPLERDDPFSVENRRLREADKTLWQKAKKEFSRQFAPGGLLPESVFAEKITRDSEFQAVEFDVRHLSGGLNKAVNADYGVDIDNLTAEQMKPLAEALSGKVDPAIPEGTRVAIVAMRQYIDSLSGEYLSILQKQVEANMQGADQALIDKITGNLGAYVNRSYQAFDDPNWFKTVPTDVVNAARAYLAKGYTEHGETPAEAARLADVTVNEMLKTGTAYDSMGAFIAEGKLGAKDLTVLIKRKEIAPEIRALLGEYMDPRLNFAKSATKMGRLVWNQRFLDRVQSFGMGTFLFEGKDRPADATTQIAGDKSETYAPLNGLWTFPEVAQAFQDALGKEQMSDLYRTVVRLNGMVKYGKTILSPTTAMRNWQSAMFFSLANGHFDLTQMKHSWAAMREQVTQNATGDDLTYLRKLKQLGVVYDTPYAGEMMALLQDARMDELLSSKSGTGLKWLRKANQFAQGFYSFGDDFWKIIGYENEKASLIAAGIPEAEAETMAAKRIRDTYPTYSMIGKAVQWLRRFPLMGTFVSFPSEIIRTTVNMMKLTAADLKSDNPKIQALGRKRAAGMAMVSAGFYALSAMTAAALGVGDDEEEALRDLSAPWSKNSTFLYTGRDADGKLRYFDMSFLDPYGYWKRPLTAMLRDQPWEDAAVSGLSDMLSPFFGADITAGAIFEVLANKKPTGGQVYNEHAGSVDQLQDISNHMRKALQPGFVSNGERLWLAGSDARREGSGQPYDMRDEVVSLLGWRAATLDTQTGLYYRSFDFTDALTDAKKTLTRTLRSSNDVSEGDIQESKQAANAQYQKAFTEMGRLVSSAEAAGMSRREVMQTLKLSGVAQRNIVALLNGRVPEMDIGMQAQAKAVKQAGVMRGSEHAAEIARRFRLAREQ